MSSVSIAFENTFSKYVLEPMEHIVFTIFSFPKQVFWDLKSIQFLLENWYLQYSGRVQQVFHFSFCPDKVEIDDAAFLASPHCERLRILCPTVDRAFQENRLRQQFSVADGTCLGQCLTAFKYHSQLDVSKGWSSSLNLLDLQHQVLYLQTIHDVATDLRVKLEIMRHPDSKKIKLQDITTPEGRTDEGKAFHALRMAGCSRKLSRQYCTSLADIMRQPAALYEQRRTHLKDVISRVNSMWLKQRPLGGAESVRPFFTQQNGQFIFLATGNRVGHAMFVKIENGRCFTFDPATRLCFTAPQTPEGISETFELMKRVLLPYHLGSQLFFSVLAPH